MANFITDTKKKIQDLFVYIVSCGKSSKEASGNDQETARDAPLGDDDLGLKVFIPLEESQEPAINVPPIRNNAQGQGRIIVLHPENVTNNGLPITDIPPVQDSNIEQQGQELDESSQEQKQEEPNKDDDDDDDDIEPLPFGFIPEERANISRPPGKRSAPIPKTG